MHEITAEKSHTEVVAFSSEYKKVSMLSIIFISFVNHLMYTFSTCNWLNHHLMYTFSTCNWLNRKNNVTQMQELHFRFKLMRFEFTSNLLSHFYIYPQVFLICIKQPLHCFLVIISLNGFFPYQRAKIENRKQCEKPQDRSDRRTRVK